MKRWKLLLGKLLIGLWRGDPFHVDAEIHEQTREQVRRNIASGRQAMLDGEIDWGRRMREVVCVDERPTTDGSKTPE